MENSADKNILFVHEKTKDDDTEEKLPPKTCCNKVSDFIIKNYLPISLIIAVILGALVPQFGMFFNHKATQYICVIGIFLYSGLCLRTAAIKDAVQGYIPAIWGIVSILGVTCIVGGQLTLLLPFNTDADNPHMGVSNETEFGKQNVTYFNVTYPMNNKSNWSKDDSGRYFGSLGPLEFQTALIVYFSMPCTISSGVVMVTQLNGNFALALLLTVFANIAGVVTIPLFLKWMLSSATQISLDVLSLLLRLSLTILLPIIIGKCLRFVKIVKRFVTIPKRKLVLKLISVTLLAIITWVKVSKTSSDGGLNRLKAVSIIFVIAWALTMHIIFLLLNTFASVVLRLPSDQKKCIIILASQKTLAVAIPVIGFLPPELGDQGLVAISLVICHISIILFDSVLIPLWLILESRNQK